MITEKTAWDFVEEFYPNYSSSNVIAHNGDLQKILDGQWEKGDCAYQLLQDEYDGNENDPQVQLDFNESLVRIYEEAIEAYLNQDN